MIQYRALIFCSIFLLIGLTDASEGSPLYNLTHEILETLEIIPYDIKMLIKTLTPDFGKYISNTAACIKGELQGLSCNFNFSFDPISVLEQCTKDTGFDLIIQGATQLVPATFLPFYSPPKVSQNRCFQLSSIPFLPEVVSVLTHPIEDIVDIVEGGVYIIEKPIEVAVDSVKNLISGAVNIITKPIKGAVDIIEKPIKGAVDIIENPIEGAVNLITKPIKGAVDIVEKPIKGAVDLIKKPIDGILDVLS